MKTAIGDYLRRLRLERGEVLKDMSEKLDVSAAFLSAVENGKKKFPEKWYLKLQELYSLDDTEVEALRDAALESSRSIRLNLQGASDERRKLAVSFARSFDSLDEKTSKEIFEILNKENNNRD